MQESDGRRGYLPWREVRYKWFPGTGHRDSGNRFEVHQDMRGRAGARAGGEG